LVQVDSIRQLLTVPRIAAVLVLAACVAGGAWLLLGAGITSPAQLADGLQDTIDSLPRLVAALLMFVIATMCLVCLMPSPIVLAACGLLLGAWVGAAVGIAAIGAAVAIERLLALTIVGRLLHERLARRHPHANERIASWGLVGVMLVRALGTPTTVIAWASSATALRAWAVSVGCMLGTLPRGLAYATLGASGASLLRPTQWTWQVWASVGLLVVLLGVSSAVAWTRTRARGSSPESP
jgi:uncharacterized membrane protein YdjX (TVP38/TMEM64 family)